MSTGASSVEGPRSPRQDPPGHADDAEQARRTLELLVETNQAVLSELSLRAVLHRIVVSARELVGARYGALGVVGPDGGLTEFVHVGMEEADVRRLGHLPTGGGLLGALVVDPRPLRLERISDDPRRAGFPEHHPPMESFLGVPLRVRDAVYGNLYLTERTDGGPFTAEDERTIGALGVAAGIAIENARLYQDSGRRQHWAEAAAEITAVLLDPSSGADAVGMVADTVLRLACADVVSVVVPDPDGPQFRVEMARGAGASTLRGTVYPAARSVAALALRTGRGVRVGTEAERGRFVFHLDRVLESGAVMGVPLRGSASSYGVLVVARRRGRPAFDAVDLDLAESFAAQAALALELAQARADQQRLAVLEDRERIARDLHDHVIQRLFASGLTLEGTLGVDQETAAARVSTVVDELDDTIRQIRTLIFQLQSGTCGRTLRSAVLDVVGELTRALGSAPSTEFVGPVDTVAPDGRIDDVVAVVREGLTNVARHAQAAHVRLRVEASAVILRVTVCDDGRGLSGTERRSGLDNLSQRALHYGGHFELVGSPTGGTELRWAIPLR